MREMNATEKLIAEGYGGDRTYYINDDGMFTYDEQEETSMLPTDVKERKETPIYSGVLMYFPKAMAAVAACSYIANEQHNPGTKMHWDRAKSGDELDALTRHLLEAGTMDTDGILHSTKVAWRALANLEKEIEGAT